jgi:hypothetical protein
LPCAWWFDPSRPFVGAKAGARDEGSLVAAERVRFELTIQVFARITV